MRGPFDPRRAIKAICRKAIRWAATTVSAQSAPQNLAPRGIPAFGDANLVQQAGSIPHEPPGARTFSLGSVVEAGESPCPKTDQAVHGLWRRHGIRAFPRSHCRIFGS